MTTASERFPIPSISDQPMYELIWLRHSLPSVQVGQEKGVYDLLAKNSATINELATELDLPSRAAEAIVAISAGLGFLSCGDGDRFSLTELGRSYLSSESPFHYGRLMPEDDAHLLKLREAVEKGDGPVDPRAVGMAELDPKAVSYTHLTLPTKA